jgi:hypothetical protein
MKQLYIQTAAQNRKSIKDAFSGNYKPIFYRESTQAAAPITPPKEGQGGGFKFSKGPPGRSRSPGVGDGLFPDHPPDRYTPDRWGEEGKEEKEPNIINFKSCKMAEIHLNTEVQTFNTKLF